MKLRQNESYPSSTRWSVVTASRCSKAGRFALTSFIDPGSAIASLQ